MTDTAPEALSEGEVNEQAEYAHKLVLGLVPTVQKLMDTHRPPDGRSHSAVAGFIQAFTELELSIAVACEVSPMQLVQALRMIAEDIEHDVIRAASQMKEGPTRRAPREAAAEIPKVDF